MKALEPDDPRCVGTDGRRYRILARTGSGGVGVVYFGRSPGGRAVAVKVAHPEIAGDREFRARFRQEVEVARSIGGGYTAAVLDADPSARAPWLVTEFLPWPSVRDAVPGFGAPAPGTVREPARPVAEALRALHEAGAKAPETVVTAAPARPRAVNGMTPDGGIGEQFARAHPSPQGGVCAGFSAARPRMASEDVMRGRAVDLLVSGRRPGAGVTARRGAPGACGGSPRRSGRGGCPTGRSP